MYWEDLEEIECCYTCSKNKNFIKKGTECICIKEKNEKKQKKPQDNICGDYEAG